MVSFWRQHLSTGLSKTAVELQSFYSFDRDAVTGYAGNSIARGAQSDFYASARRRASERCRKGRIDIPWCSTECESFGLIWPDAASKVVKFQTP